MTDLRYALRSLARAKGLLAVLLVSLGLGTGANATVFSAVHGLLFEAPPGIEQPSEMADIYTSGLDGSTFGPSSYPDLISIAETIDAFSSVAAVDDQLVANISAGGISYSRRIAAASDAFFTVLAMDASRGRVLSPADAHSTLPGAVLSHELWTTLGEEEGIVGQKVQIAAREHVVVGVAPPGFRGLRAGRPTDIWIPLPSQVLESTRGDRRLSLLGRLRRGASVEDAHRALRQLSERLASQHPETNRGTHRNPDEPRTFTAVAYSKVDPATRPQTAVVAGVIASTVVLLLASACVNAGSLLLSRALTRRREIAVKMALGATRPRVMRQVLFETLVVTVAGASLGLLFAFWTSRIIPSLFAPEHAAMLDVMPGALTIIATVLVSAIAGAAFGSIPAIQGTSESPASALRADAGEVSDEPRGFNWRAGLVVVQLALSVVLLVGTAVLTTSLATALEGDFAHISRNVAVFTVKTPATFAYHQRAVATLKGAGHTQEVVWAQALPLTINSLQQFRIEGNQGVLDAIELNMNVVSPRYFAAMRLPIIEGRTFSAGDHGLADTVVVIDELLARRYFGTTAVGRVLIDALGRRAEIVGVVRSGRYRTLQQAPTPTVYFSTTQVHLPRGNLLLRTSTDPAPLLDDLQKRLIASGFAVERASTLEGRISETLVLERMVTTLVAGCGSIALVLAIVGVYGIINDSVRRRTREIGLRVALGAGRGQIVRLVLWEALVLTGVGILAGIIAAVAIDRAATLFVHGLPPVEARALIATPGLLAIVVGVASVLPLRRALRVSPTIALRAQ